MMPRHFFDSGDDSERAIRDERGLEFDGPEAACRAAVAALPALARDALPDDGSGRTARAQGDADAGRRAADLTRS